MNKKKKRGLSRMIVDAVYDRRIRRGTQVCSLQKLEKLRGLNPEIRPEESARELAVKKCRIAMVCMAVAIVLSLSAFITGDEGRLAGDNTLARPSKGEKAEEVDLTVHIDDKDYDIQVEVAPVPFTDEEVDWLFDKAQEEYLSALKGKNESLQAVREDLNFISSCSIHGMEADWETEKNDCIRYDGRVDSSKIQKTENINIYLTMTYEERGEIRGRRTVKTTVDVLPPEVSEGEQLQMLVESAVAEAGQEGSDRLVLPAMIGGNPASYSEPSGRGIAGLLAALGVVTAAVMAYLQEKQLNEAAEKRDGQLLLDYGEFVSELTVLTGAGLSVRQAWNRIICDMQSRQEAGAERRYLYREMLLTKNAMDRGVSEEYAYRDFGRRCGQPPYLRLGSLLETNIRKGSKGMNDLLRREADDAFGDRMQLARRQGEKISSKLLIPMMLFFMLVLVILMVPAFLSF